jgi:AraC-like DNA-binding protein
MTVLEAGLRGAAMALLLLLAIVGWRDARHTAVGRYSVLIELCAIAYLIESAPPITALNPVWIVPIRLVSNTGPALFPLWVAANFDDSFVPKWWRWLPFGGMIALASWAIATDWMQAWIAVRIAALLLVGVGISQTLAGRKADLIEGRRRFRLILAVGAGALIVGLNVPAAAASERIRDIVGAGGVFALALAAAMLRLRVEMPPGLELKQVPAVAATGRPRHVPSTAIDGGEERVLLDRLQLLMENDRIYREEGLGVAALASRLKIPEYRLRRLINQRLSHRNFTSFVNSYRLAETMLALADPSQKHVPILTIALDAGFGSIGPFNRAFKAHTGRTPTEFRRDRCELGQTHTANYFPAQNSVFVVADNSAAQNKAAGG